MSEQSRKQLRQKAENIARGMVARQLMEIRNWPFRKRAALAWRILIGR